MKEEIGHLPGSSNIVCQCCGSPLSWREINQKEYTFTVQLVDCGGDRYKYSRSTREYICDACVRDSKINTILSTN
jgi:hypothetical protein